MIKLSDNILSWCNNPEDEAVKQAINISKHPCLIGNVCLMPDTHAGYGMPIGGVVAFDNAVCPNMVGVDIGCTDGETEYLTLDGWKKIKDYNGEKILIYNRELNTSYFDMPLAYIKKPTKKFYHLKNQVVDQMLTGEHKVLLFSSHSKNPDYNVDAELDYWLNKNNTLRKGVNHLFRNYIPNYTTENNLDYTDDELRLIVAISADGRIRNNNIEFHFKKQRKIARLTKLCDALNIKINVHSRADDSFGCTINFSKALKDLTPLYRLNVHQLGVVYDEIQYWDGHLAKDGQLCYSTTIKNNADFIQFVLSTQGIRCNFSAYQGKENWNTCYQVYSTNNNQTAFPTPEQITTITGDDLTAYCFTTNTGFWIMRRDGKIVITGNCGMLAVKTSLTDVTKEQLLGILGGSREYKGGIKANIPVGFDHHKKKQDNELFKDKRWNSCTICSEEFESAQYQLGTLGGGNHFIEIQKGDDDHIWFMIHSGSRNLGYKVAKYYDEIAKELCTKWKHTDVVKNDLAFLPRGTKEFDDYLDEMDLCLDFAYQNRQQMAKVIKESFTNIIPDVEFLEEINIHHNYVELENHYSRNVFVHRKGATLARKNTIGIIPGSQGTASYIVKGLGNEASLCSCSHGAGRKMSRKKAQETLDLAKEQEILNSQGILHSMNCKSALDEAASAYKDIDIVMEEQKDLVQTLVKLRPLAVIKG